MVWDTVNLGDLVKIVSGKSPSLFSLSGHGKYPYLKVEDLNNSEKYQEFSREYSNNSEGLVPENSIIFPKRGAAILNNKVRINRVPVHMDSNLMAIFPKTKQLYFEYLYYKIVFEQLHRIADTSTIPQINNKHILPFKILLPEFHEQKLIANLLSTWDRAIDLTTRLIAQKELQKKWLMQHLLTGRKRLKSYKGAWKELKLGEMTVKFSRRNGRLIDAPVYSVTNSDGFVLQAEQFEREVASEDLSSYKIIRKGDFAYNPARVNVGSLAYFEKEVGLISSLYVCFRTNQHVDDYFLLQLLQLDRVKHAINSYGEGGVRVYLWYDLFAKIKIRVPEIEEQLAIVEVIRTSEIELKKLQLKVRYLREQRRGLMQVLLTGRKRLRVGN